MSDIKALEELRELCASVKSMDFASVGCDAVLEITDEIEQEIAERFMELPVDADGVPIKPGDVLDFDSFKAKCAAVSQERIYYWNEYGYWTWKDASECRHDKPRTIEDVLREVAKKDGTKSVEWVATGNYFSRLDGAIEWIWHQLPRQRQKGTVKTLQDALSDIRGMLAEVKKNLGGVTRC